MSHAVIGIVSPVWQSTQTHTCCWVRSYTTSILPWQMGQGGHGGNWSLPAGAGGAITQASVKTTPFVFNPKKRAKLYRSNTLAELDCWSVILLTSVTRWRELCCVSSFWQPHRGRLRLTLPMSASGQRWLILLVVGYKLSLVTRTAFSLPIQ